MSDIDRQARALRLRENELHTELLKYEIGTGDPTLDDVMVVAINGELEEIHARLLELEYEREQGT